MTILQWVNTAVIAIGIPTIVGALIYIGKKLYLLESLEKSTEKIKHNMKVVGDYLTRHHTKFNPSDLKAFSPLNLTEAGKKFISSIGFENVFEKNKSDFFQCIESENPKLKYDVEVAAIKSIYVLYDKPYMEFLKVLFYNDPNRNMENSASTFGVYVRDKYLADHPEITQ